MEFFKKVKNYAFTVSIVYIIIGLIMLLNPSFVCNAVNYIVGIFVLVFGILYLINLYVEKVNISKFNFLAGVLSISFGVFLIINTDILVSLIPFCSGIIILLDSIYQFKNSILLKRYKQNDWWISLIVGIIFVLFAIYVIVYSKNITYLIIRIIGGVLIADGAMDFYSYFRLKKCTDAMKVIETDIIKEK